MAAANTNTRTLELSDFDKLAEIQALASWVSSILNMIWETKGFAKLPSHHQCTIQALFDMSKRLDEELEQFYIKIKELEG